MAQALIHRDELDPNLGAEEFLQQMIILAKERGLSKTEAQVRTEIQRNIKIQQSREIERYDIRELSDAKAVNCYYFRNKNGVFLGEFEPYFTLNDMEIEDNADNFKNYWQEWERQFPNFHLMDIESSSHMTMLHDTKAQEEISAFCETLYSNNKIKLL